VKNEAYIRVIANVLLAACIFHPSWRHLPFYGFYEVARSEIRIFQPFWHFNDLCDGIIMEKLAMIAKEANPLNVIKS
jgi:hypothetical protein